MQKNGQARKFAHYSTLPNPHSRSVKSNSSSALPTNLTSLVGRTNELHTLRDWLPRHRLITLVGPGGVGKTRLAIAAAAENQARFRQGVCFVPLVAVTTTERLVSSIATGLGLTFYGREEPLEQLINHLHTRHMLLVLDNFEQLLPAVDVLIHLLEKASEIHILVTSRDRLNCYGEKVFLVESLPFPVQEIEALTDTHSAVQLFVERAQAVCPDFEFTDVNRQDVVHICQLVGGLPLGLELAAPWVRMLSCAEIARELMQNLDFLTAVLSGVPERHRSLKAVFAYSWQRLTETEQEVFRALTIFPDSFERTAAEAVAEVSLPVLSSLLDKSFLYRQTSARFAIHPVMREYGREELHQAQAYDTYANRHSTYYLDFLQQQREFFSGEKQNQALEQIEIEIDNIRQAWMWAVTQQHADQIKLGLKALYDFYQYQYHQQEGIALFRQALETLQQLCVPQDEPVLRQIQARLGALHNHLRQYDEARRWLQEGLKASRAAGDDRETASALFDLARLNIRQQNFDEAREQSRQSLALFEQLGDQLGIAENLICLGQIAHLHDGNYDEACKFYKSAWEVGEQTDDAFLKTVPLRWLAIIAYRYHHDYVQAISYLEQAQSICRSKGLYVIEARVLRTLSDVYSEQGQYFTARGYADQALRVTRDLGDRFSEGLALVEIGITYVYCHMFAAARTCLSQALLIAEAVGEGIIMARIHRYLGQTYAWQGDFVTACAHLEQALQISQKIGYTVNIKATLTSLGFVSLQRHQYQRARAYCDQALRIAHPLCRQMVQREALIYLGHALAGLEHWTEAIEAYRRAIDLVRNMPVHLSLEPWAGLAAVFLAQGNLSQALAHVDEILNGLNAETLQPDYVPLRVYWHSYCVLKAHQDERANTVLHAAHRLLEARADQIENGQLRRSYLRRVQENEAILNAFARKTTREEAQATSHLSPAISLNPLTGREEQILRLVAKGLSNQEIADQLVVSINTVKRHLTNIYQKLNVTNRRQAVRRAETLNLL